MSPKASKSATAALIATVVGVAVLLALGTWQVQRLGWKRDLIATMEERLAAAPLTDVAAVDPETDAFRRLMVEGRYDDAREFRLLNKVHRGRAGIHVITPFATVQGPTVLVDRGWLPEERLADLRETTPSPAPATVTGVVRPPQRQGPFRPDNDVAGNRWFFVDVAAMAARAGPGTVERFYLEAVPDASAAALPIAREPAVRLRNDHLQYALTWYALAVALAVIYILWRRKFSRQTSDGAAPP